MKRVAKHKRSVGLGRRHAGRAAKRCLRARAANFGFFDSLAREFFSRVRVSKKWRCRRHCLLPGL